MLLRKLTLKNITTSARSALAGAALRGNSMSTAAKSATATQLFNPTDEHLQLREMLRSFVEAEVDPQVRIHPPLHSQPVLTIIS